MLDPSPDVRRGRNRTARPVREDDYGTWRAR
jgi:hypothetical protein